MAQLSILAVSFALIWWIAHWFFIRQRQPLHLSEEENFPSATQKTHFFVTRSTSRLRDHSRAASLLRRLCNAPTGSTSSAADHLRENSRQLLLYLLEMQKALRDAPRLPASQGIPRMLMLCQRHLHQGGTVDAPQLLAALESFQQVESLTLPERLCMPLCMKLCLSSQLADTLHKLELSLREMQLGQQLARRLMHTRKPMLLLEKQQLSIAATHAMLTHLHAYQETTLLTVLEERLLADGSSAVKIAEQHALAQSHITDRISAILTCFNTLDKLNWPDAEEAVDPLHQQFLHDPTGVYPRMDASSRMLYRQRAATLARLFVMDEARLTRALLTLCREADPDGLRDHIGWYLLEPQGMQALARSLQSRRGRMLLFLQRHASLLRRAGLAACALGLGFAFLNRHHPLWMLPFFLGVCSCLTHFLARLITLKLLPATLLPRMAVEQVTEELRTLVVIPAVVHDHTQMVPLVRRLLLARKAFPEGAIDCLLLADYDDCITQTSSEDTAIVSAARMAMEAVDGDGGRMIYLQRRRVWSGDQRCYIGRDRRHGALESLNKLIVHGECEDEFDAATLPLSFFHRRYTYVLTLNSDAAPAPDSLLPLIGALSHPLNERRHTAEGIRGVSILTPCLAVNPSEMHSRLALWEAGHDAQHGHFQGMGLYRPDTLLEATDAWLLPHTLLCPDLLEGELAGCAQDASTAFYFTPHATVAEWLKRLHRRVRSAWQMLPWLLPHVKTPSGVRRNPLGSNSRYLIRQALRRSLIPICQLALLLYAVLARSGWLLLLALLAPALPLHPRRWLVHMIHLPLRAVLHGDAIVKAMWGVFTRRHQLDRLPAALANAGASLSVWENWSQALTIIAFSAASLAISPVSVPGLVLGGLFALFPLMHPHLDAPIALSPRPTPEMEVALMEAAEATWRFFTESVTAQTHHLPPESVQLKPFRGAAHHTTPRAMGMHLLSCLAARELGIIGTDDMCRRLADTLSSMEQLPLWHGLPYASYATDTLTVTEPQRISSVDCGILCACLIAVAQGLRTYLPETGQEHLHLAQRADDFAARMELARLYDPAAQLFATGYDIRSDSLEDAHHTLYASEAQLLSFVAVMRREIPLAHLARLNRTQVRTGRSTPCVSWGGTLSEYLLPRILLPTAHGSMMDRTIQSAIRAQRSHSVDGMFGMSDSCWWGFDAQMNYQRRTWGVPELALGPCRVHPVLAPYAAALCLPFDLKHAFDSLMHMRSRGMLGRMGYFDSIDLDPAHLSENASEAVVQCHVASHQGMLLCAVCNVLTDNALTQHFAAVPASSAAALLLMEKHHPQLILPPRLIHPENIAPKEPSFRRIAQGMTLPLDAHLVGSPEAMLLMSAQGLGMMRSRGVNLTRFTGDPTQLEGIQFYLHDGLSTYRLTDPTLPGETIFQEGCIRFVRVCGSMQCTLTAMTDPVQGSFLHVVEIANQTAREQTVDLADCLVPELLSAPSDDHAASELCIQTGRPEERVLTLTRRPCADGESPMTLCHAISTHEPLLALAAQTDRMAFQGRNHTLAQPLSLRQPLRDGLVGMPVAPCASFRARLRVGPKARAAVIFVTRLLPPGEAFSLEALSPRLSDVESRLTTSRLLSRTITDSLLLTQERASTLTRLFGALLWRCQPHQGALSPLKQPLHALRSLKLDPQHPLLTLMLHSDACAALVRDAADAVSWLQLMGQAVELCILCEGDQASAALSKAREVLGTLPAAVHLSAQLPDGLRETIEALSRVILYEGAGTLIAQLEALAVPLPVLPAPPPAPAAPALEEETLQYENGIGGFQPGTDDYVIRLAPGEATPAPWCSLLTGERFGTLCTESGLCTSFAGNSRLHRLTPWRSDPVCPIPGEAVYLSDGTGIFTPLEQVCARRVQLSPGVSTWQSLGHGLDMTLTAAVIPHTAFGSRTLRLKNITQEERRLTMTIAVRFVMGEGDGGESLAYLTSIPDGVVAHSPAMPQLGCVSLVEHHGETRVVNPLAFQGFSPLPNLDAPEDEAGTLGLIFLDVVIPAGGSEHVTWLMGACRQMDDLERLLDQLRHSGVSQAYRAARQQWAQRLDKLRISTPEEHLDLLVNRILPWQVRTQLEARCSFGHAEGAFVFRDLLLSVAALTLTEPERARAQLLHCTRHQYTDGNVQRQWHFTRTGPRSASADDRLYLPFITCWYIQRTGDSSLLQELCPWQLTSPGDDQKTHTPDATQETDTLYVHCLRALTSVEMGPHGLPLLEGNESIWLGMFYASTLDAFARYADDAARAEMAQVLTRLTQAIEQHGWDGSWYLRSIDKDGKPQGSAANAACRLDGLTQGWAVLSLGASERTAQAIEHAWQQLYDPRRGVMKQFTPPFDSGCYPPGIAENGGQHTPTAVIMLQAMCALGWTDRAWELVRALNPIHHGMEPDRYRLEPYALAEFLHSHPQQNARGYRSMSISGAAWLYATIVENMLGLEKRGDQVRLRPLVPADWEGFTITLREGNATWHFHAGRDIAALSCDGMPVPTGWITLTDDGRTHEVRTPLRGG